MSLHWFTLRNLRASVCVCVLCLRCVFVCIVWMWGTFLRHPWRMLLEPVYSLSGASGTSVALGGLKEGEFNLLCMMTSRLSRVACFYTPVRAHHWVYPSVKQTLYGMDLGSDWFISQRKLLGWDIQTTLIGDICFQDGSTKQSIHTGFKMSMKIWWSYGSKKRDTRTWIFNLWILIYEIFNRGHFRSAKSSFKLDVFWMRVNNSQRKLKRLIWKKQNKKLFQFKKNQRAQTGLVKFRHQEREV